MHQRIQQFIPSRTVMRMSMVGIDESGCPVVNSLNVYHDQPSHQVVVMDVKDGDITLYFKTAPEDVGAIPEEDLWRKDDYSI